jgi:hypothetical protein
MQVFHKTQASTDLGVPLTCRQIYVLKSKRGDGQYRPALIGNDRKLWSKRLIETTLLQDGN